MPKPLKWNGSSSLREMTAAEIDDNVDLILDHFSGMSSNNTGHLAMNAEAGWTDIGTFADTRRDQAQGTHPANTTVHTDNYVFRQNLTDVTPSPAARRFAVKYVSGSYTGLIEMTDAECRADIVDRNGELISRNIKSYHAAIKPNLINNKETFLINIKLNFPKISNKNLKKKLARNKYFYLKKRLTENEKNKLWSLGEKGIIIETTQTRIYPHKALFSHILGQIDYDNYGISGVEKFFDKNLKDVKLIKKPLALSLDTNIQYLIKNELKSTIHV